MQLGLVTYNWGKDWDLPTLIKNCRETGYAGVELRTTHKHGVEPSLGPEKRAEVAALFEDGGVVLVGLGTVCEYQSPDPAVLKKNIEESKAFIKLAHDCGGGGIKIRPNGLPKDVPAEKTIEQIGKAMRQVAEFGDGYGVQIRMEVHGPGTCDLAVVQKIMEIADHKNAAITWNCNAEDFAGDGLEKNFERVKKWMGTIHIHDLRKDNYPWKKLFDLLRGMKFEGWTLLEEGSAPENLLEAMKEVRAVWAKLAS